MTISLDDFTGGLWIPEEASPTTEQPGFAVPANALLIADDLEYLPSGGVKGRRGRTLYNASSLGSAVRGLFRHYTRQGAAVTGPNSSTNPSGGANAAVFGWPGTIAWTNLTKAGAFDNDPVTVSLTDLQQSQFFALADFVFVIPPSATIVGVQVDVARRVQVAVANEGQIYDTDVRLLRGGTGQYGDNRAVKAINWLPRYVSTEPAPDFSYWSYGGPADVWGFGTSLLTLGLPLTPADFNSGNNLTVLLACKAVGGSVIAEVDHIRMTVFYEDNSQAHRFIAERAPVAGFSTYYSGSGGVFSVITGGTVGASSNRPRFVNWPEKNATFVFDGKNPVLRYNGTVMETVITGALNGIRPHRGPYATLWKDRLWASEPAESNFSVYASALFDETEWPPEAQLSVNDPQGGTLTGLVGLLDRLVILKNTSLWAFQGDVEFGPAQLTRYSDEGCVAPDSVASCPWGILYVGRAGVYLTDGQSPNPLEVSRAIRPLWIGRTGRNVYTGAVGVYHPRSDRYILNLDPSASNVCYALQRIVVPDRRGNEPGVIFAWSRLRNTPLNAATVFAGESDQGELYVGDTSGSVFEADIGSTDPSSTAIALDMLTAQRLFDAEGRRVGRIYQMEPLFRGATPASMAIRYDQDLTDSLTFATVGSTPASAEEQEPRVYVSNREEFGRFFSVRFTHTNAGGGVVEVHRIDVDFKLRSRRPWQDPRPT